jgi:hypothetical protein
MHLFAYCKICIHLVYAPVCIFISNTSSLCIHLSVYFYNIQPHSVCNGLYVCILHIYTVYACVCIFYNIHPRNVYALVCISYNIHSNSVCTCTVYARVCIFYNIHSRNVYAFVCIFVLLCVFVTD